ncbi:MAG: phosphate/phosphite/phosphonate ABC transporter substrate-binding protein [Pseudomonadota bacterium]
MTNLQHRLRKVAGTLALGLLCALAQPYQAVGAEETVEGSPAVLTIARVSQNPRKHFKALGALGAYLAPRLKTAGIRDHRVRLAKDNDQMMAWLHAGEVDLIMETPFSAITYERNASGQILMRAWKSGVPSYRTVFVARKDGEVSSLADLAGRLVAFEDAGSTSGFFVPLTTLLDRGMTVTADDGSDRNGDQNDVRYLFAGSEVNVTAWVARGRVDAGAYSDRDWHNSSKAPLNLKKDLFIFHETPEMIRSLIVVRSGLADTTKRQISELLASMHDSKEGRDTLKALYKTERFDRIDGDVADSLDHMRTLVTAFWASRPVH